MITYVPVMSDVWEVRLDGKLTGNIVLLEQGWRYQPKGRNKSFYGDFFPTLAECKQSLEVA